MRPPSPWFGGREDPSPRTQYAPERGPVCSGCIRTRRWRSESVGIPSVPPRRRGDISPMSTLKFDIPAPTPPAILDGAITSVQVVDLDGNPNLVVEAGAGFTVPVRWQLTGILAPLVINDWHVRLFAESIGGGFEGKLAEVTAAVPTLINPTHVQYDA